MRLNISILELERILYKAGMTTSKHKIVRIGRTNSNYGLNVELILSDDYDNTKIEI